MALRVPMEVTIPPLGLGGSYAPPEAGAGVVVFAHGSGSGRSSPRNRFVAEGLREAGLGTLLFDLCERRRRRTAARCSTSRCWRGGRWTRPIG